MEYVRSYVFSGRFNDIERSYVVEVGVIEFFHDLVCGIFYVPEIYDHAAGARGLRARCYVDSVVVSMKMFTFTLVLSQTVGSRKACYYFNFIHWLVLKKGDVKV